MISVSLNQTDIRISNKLKTQRKKYLAARLILAKVSKTGFEFKQCSFEREKIVSIDRPLEAGTYVLLVEIYGTELFTGEKIRVCTYSEFRSTPISLIHDDKYTFFNKAELEIWKNYALTTREKRIATQQESTLNEYEM